MNKVWFYSRELLIAIFGGLVGAIFGLYSLGKAGGVQSWILITIYAGIILLILLILDFLFNK
jgi:hypothetical protein